MKKKLLLVFASFLLIGCKTTDNKSGVNNSGSTTTQTNTGNNSGGQTGNGGGTTNTGTGEGGNTGSGTGESGNTGTGESGGTNTGTGESGNTGTGENGNTGSGTGESGNTGTGESGNTGTGESGNTGDTTGYTDVTFQEAKVAPGFDSNLKIREQDARNKEYTNPVNFNDCLSVGYDNIAPHFYKGQFDKKLTAPSETVRNFDELVYVFDYCGFYGVSSFNVKFDASYSFTAASKEFNKAFWKSRMLCQTAGYEFEPANGGYVINFKLNEFTSTAISTAELSKSAVNPFTISQTGGDYITTIPYTATKGDLDVSNTDQLLYALDNGYNPVCAPNSKADLTYRKACYLLTHTIKDNMNDLQKIYAVNNCIFNLSDYDESGEVLACGVLANQEDELANPFFIASTFVSFFAEGPLLYGLGTCAGFAKAQSLMFSLLGINHMRVTAGYCVLEDTIYSKDPVEGYYYHEYNYYITNDKYYICDITYTFGGGTSYVMEELYRYPVRKISVALTRAEWGRAYDPDGNFNDYVKVYMGDKVGTVDLESYKQIYINGTKNIVGNDYDSLKACFDAGLAEINSYKASNNVTGKQLYLLSFWTECNTEDSILLLYGAADRLCDENSGIIAFSWYHYMYGIHYFVYC